MASIALNRLGPSAAASAMVSTSEGMESITSIMRIIMASPRPPSTPDKQPSSEPIPPAITTTASPALIDCWLPASTRLNRSRPTSSVPNQCSADGACRRAVKSSALGSCGTIHGDVTISRSIRIMIAAPISVRGLLRSIQNSFAQLMPAFAVLTGTGVS